jgi:hypothetical protein
VGLEVEHDAQAFGVEVHGQHVLHQEEFQRDVWRLRWHV